MDVATAADALDQAVAQHAAGRLSQAEEAFRLVLASHPDNPDALNLLGLLLQDKGQYQDSLGLITRALAIDPDFPEALTNLARVQRAIGDPQAALQSASRAAALDPDLPEAFLQLASCLIDLRSGPDAEAALRRLLMLQPDHPQAAVKLAQVLLWQGKPDDALATFQTVLRQDHNSVPAIIGSGRALGLLHRLDEALTCHQRAVALAPDLVDAHAALALTLRLCQDPAASALSCRAALAIAPNRPDLWLLLGTNLAFLGDFQQAATCQQHALALKPHAPEAWRDLSMTAPSADSETIPRLQSTLADPAAQDTQRIDAGFALGRLFDASSEYNAAFTAYATANRLANQKFRQAAQGFDLASLRRHVDWSIETFRPALFDQLATNGDPSDCPVFIVGMPRSGTTLVEQIAASHPLAYGAGERKDIHTLVARLSGQNLLTSPSDWDAATACALASEYIGRLTTISQAAERVINKLPDNVLFLGQIALLFPNARIILCRRDLRDTCLSAFFQQFGDGMAWTYDLADCADRAQEIERLIDHWRSVLPLPVLEIDYDALVTDLEGQSRRLIAFLGLDWDPACLRFHETRRTVTTASFWQVRQPLYTASSGRWKHYRQHLAPLLLGLSGLVPPPEPRDWTQIFADPDAALQAAARHHQAGRLQAAEPVYREALRRDPTNPTALHLLGLLTLHRGQPQAAIPLLEASLRVKPDVPATLLDLARAQRSAHNPQAALTTAQQALTLDSKLPDAHAEMAQSLLALGQPDRALPHAHRALEADPNAVDALLVAATLTAAQGRHDQAEAFWRRLLNLLPDKLEPLNGLANAIAAQDRFDEAIDIQRQAMERFPGNPHLLNQLAWLLCRSQDPAAISKVCEAALVHDPDQTELWLLLANCRVALGQFSQAASCYRHALTLDPACGAACAGLLQIGEAEQTDDLLARSQAVVSQATEPIEARIDAAFAVASAHEARADYDAAFAAYTAANGLAHAARTPASGNRQDALREYVDWAIRSFQPDTFSAGAHFANPSDLPCYIVGMPRSGTSLTEQIAASHPLVFGTGERADLQPMLGSDQGRQFLTPLTDWDVATVQRWSAGLLATLRQRGGGALRVINKMPDNILWLGHIALLFPNARIIVCRRDLRDVCLSCFSRYFLDPGMDWTDTLEDCAARAREIERLLAHWRTVLPKPLLEIEYETLINDLEGQSRRLINHLGLDWDPACLEFHKTERAVMTASHWQVRQPLYDTSVGKWRHYRSHLGPLFQALQGLIPASA